MPAGFHEVRFPTDIARGARGGPRRATEIVTLASGREHRNARWAHSRRRYDAGTGIKTLAALQAVVAFFEERRGQLIGFRWKDPLDFRSAAPGQPIQPGDQILGIGTGSRATFQLVKAYGSVADPYLRPIIKPVSGTVRVAVAGIEKASGAGFSIDHGTGLVTFPAGQIPAPSQAVTAGFEFDVPVRFDADSLEFDLSAFAAGEIPRIPLIEILP